MKLYTRTGDDGTTGLFGGGRVAKDHPRIGAYGTVDELNGLLGLAAAGLEPGRPFHDRCAEILLGLQSRLFDVGADLATPIGDTHEHRIRRIHDADVEEAEQLIDEADGGNEPMTHFVLPGGSVLAAHLHHARTVCRRAEREMVGLSHVEPVNEKAIRYVNRVSDLLFALARRANHDAGIADVPWIPADG